MIIGQTIFKMAEDHNRPLHQVLKTEDDKALYLVIFV